MADEAFLDRESLRCSICQDLFRNPVIIPCGHSFCKDCITRLWDQDVCRCPQCKQTFNNRPALIDWLHVKELSEKLMKMRTWAEKKAEARDVSCDSCTSRTTKAIRSCLTCLASYCSTHLEQHSELHGRRKHQLTDATDLQNKICPQHGKLVDIFCRTDQQCVCVLCAIHEHKSHDTISASDERADRQRKLMETRVKFLQNIQDREKDFKELTQTEESIRRSAQTAVTESERIFSEVLRSVQKTSCRVKELIADQQRAELNHTEGLQEKVQQKIADMKMKVSELDQFMTTEDHIHFLQNYPSDCEESMSEEFEAISSISEHPDAFFHNVRMLLSKMQERLMDVTKTTEIEIKSVKVLPPVGGTVKLSATPADQKDIFHFGESVTGFGGFSFQYVPSKSSPVLYKPAVSLPDVIEISTGEENEQVVFSHRAKLYRFDKELLQWKERGVGELKILQNDKPRRARLVMRREQVLKLCANHWITPNMKLEPMKAAEKVWMWNAFDFADGEGNYQTLAVRFKLQESADAFRKIFEEAVVTESSVPERVLPPVGGTVKLSATPADQKDIFHFGESVTGFGGFSFQYVLSKSSPVLYEPAVSLPDVIEISTGEENEQVVFSHRAKLYRFDKELLQWKERGVGELKILQNDKPRRARLVMRREQVLKLCANHWITPNMKLEPMKAAEKVWMWNAFDFADGEGKYQTLAVRFRLQESADAFRKIFEEAVVTESSVPERGKSTQDQCDADVEILFERKPTAEQAELAARLMLPHTFFCYRNQLGYLSNEDDGEDFEEAVKSLKGKLYPGLSVQGDASAGNGKSTQDQCDADVEILFERKPTAEQAELAARLMLPHTFFCYRNQLGYLSNEDDGKSTQDQCDADVEILFERKPTAEQAELAARLMLPHTFFCYRNQLGYLSNEDDGEDFEEAVKSLKGKLYPGLSVQGDASAGNDANLPQDNAGAATETQSDREEEDSDDEALIRVELPSVEENEEEMLFKEWTKLYRWDCDIKKWKARSEGDIKILFHPSRKLYRVFMWQEGDKKVCVNHCITRAIHLKRLNTSANAVTWTAADYSEGDAVLRRIAVKFKTPELAVSFTQTFTDCQSHMSESMQPLKK